MIPIQLIARARSRIILHLCYRTPTSVELSWRCAWSRQRLLPHFHRRSKTGLCIVSEPHQLVCTTLAPLAMSEHSISSGLTLASRLPLDPSLTSGELATWATPQILNIIRASTDHLEQRIIAVECTNNEIQQQTQHLQDVASATKFQHGLCMQGKSTVVVV
jgi:hypothetical protein